MMKNDVTEIESFVKNILSKKAPKSPFVPGKTLIPPSGKLIGYEEVKNMVMASFDGWLTTGRFNSKLWMLYAICLHPTPWIKTLLTLPGMITECVMHPSKGTDFLETKTMTPPALLSLWRKK